MRGTLGSVKLGFSASTSDEPSGRLGCSWGFSSHDPPPSLYLSNLRLGKKCIPSKFPCLCSNCMRHRIKLPDEAPKAAKTSYALTLHVNQVNARLSFGNPAPWNHIEICTSGIEVVDEFRLDAQGLLDKGVGMLPPGHPIRKEEGSR